MKPFHIVLAILLGVLAAPVVAEATFHIAGLRAGANAAGWVHRDASGIIDLRNFLMNNVFNALRIAFIGIAFFMFFYYAVFLLFEAGEESVVTETKTAYEGAIAGAAIVGIASFIAQSFYVDVGGGVPIVDTTQIRIGINNIVDFLKAIVAILVSLHITIQGFRLVVLQGQNESELEKQKQRFFYGLIGVAIILLVNPIINAVQPGSNSQILSDEIAGIANYLLVFFGALALFAIVVGGFFLMISIEESYRDKAKKTIFAAVIAVIVVFASYAIVNYFLQF
jgi:hypothetical protein